MVLGHHHAACVCGTGQDPLEISRSHGFGTNHHWLYLCGIPFFPGANGVTVTGSLCKQQVPSGPQSDFLQESGFLFHLQLLASTKPTRAARTPPFHKPCIAPAVVLKGPCRAIFLTPPRCTATHPTPWKEWGVGQPAPYHHLPWQRQPGEVAVGTKCREGSGGIGARDRGHIHQLPSPTREEGVRKPTDSFPVSSAEERAQLLSATGKLTEERAEPNARAGTMTVTTTRHHHNAAITEE